MKLHFLLPSLFFVAVTLGSSGDRQPAFKRCIQSCITQHCQPASPPLLPFHLRLLQWTCPTNCDYLCQRQLTQSAQQQSLPIHQYHGKWPFIRLWGIQEPASVLFSMLNGWMHLKNWHKVRRLNQPMRSWLSAFVVLGTWTWFCSAIFHIRDFPVTEKLDYFSAGLNVLYILFLAVIRMRRLETWRQTRGLVMLCSIAYLMHVGYLSLIKFDYGYNMAANALAGLLSNVCWFVVSYQSFRANESLWWKPLVLTLATDAAFSLEAFDFAPWWDTLDAHSLWHAATIPIVSEWYRYLIEDTQTQHHQSTKHKD